MRITLRQLDIHSESESDYDTAVDMAHYESTQIAYLFELSSGAQVEVYRSHTLTTRSYFEPDFDRLEAGGSLVYNHYHCDREPEESSHYHIDVRPVHAQVVLTLQDWKGMPERYRANFDSTMNQFSNPPDDPVMQENFETESVFDAIEALRLDEGQTFDASLLGPAFASWLEAVDAVSWRLIEPNLHARIASRCALAQLRLQEEIAGWATTN